MLHSYLFACSLLTLSFTYSWFSFYGVQHIWKSTFFGRKYEEKKAKPGHVVPIYMWDIYNNGVNSSEIDVVRGIYPALSGISFSSLQYQHHRRKELQFNIPKPKPDEVLVKGEVRIITKAPKNQTTYFQIYLKSGKWVFLDEKKVSDVNLTWISLKVSSQNISKPGSVTFVIITLFPSRRKNCCPYTDFMHPVLLLSYSSKNENYKNNLARRKRSLGLENYEEETNRIWEAEILPQKISQPPGNIRNTCRRKPLYIKFSEIDYDNWIVAPSGYEAFQCVGKCTFPLGEQLSPTKHAILQTLLHNISPWKASKACCVPTRLDPISVLYVDENGVLTYRFRYRDMVVAECGCR